MVTAELTTAFAMWGDKRGLPLIHWIFNLSHDESRELFVATPTSIYDDDECCVQAALWAAALGFSEYEGMWPGFVGYVGTIGGLDATILAINDRAAYEFWHPDEPDPVPELTPAHGTAYQPWPEINLDGKDPIFTLTNLINVAITRGFRTWGNKQRLPSCFWRIKTPYPGTGEMLSTVIVSDEGDDETIDHAQRWADALELQQRDYALGSIHHRGTLAGVPICVTTLTNRTDAENAANHP